MTFIPSQTFKNVGKKLENHPINIHSKHIILNQYIFIFSLKLQNKSIYMYIYMSCSLNMEENEKKN